jgi:glycosyltransferase involved in cell wall biosynthesis
MTELPGVSVLIPTLNAARYLEDCLRSIRDQDYPPDLIEIVVADAGSVDATLELLARYGVQRVVANAGITTEAGRAILNRLPSKELTLYIDADNYLVGADWLRRMVEPLRDDPTVFAAEPIQFDYRAADPPLNRYFALTGVNDPLSLFIGNYSRFSHLTGKWTQVPHQEESHEGYIVAELTPSHVPTMGSQGYIVRSDLLRQVSTSDYYFDLDGVNDLVSRGHRRIAKVDVSLGHQFARDLMSLRRKTLRRAKDYLFWRDKRSYSWFSTGTFAVARFVVYTLLIVPLVWQAGRGWLSVRDRAWLYHVPVCWLTLWIYGWVVLQSVVRRAPHSRANWHE